MFYRLCKGKGNNDLKGDFLAGVHLLDCDACEVGKLSKFYWALPWGYACSHALGGIVDSCWLKCIMFILGYALAIS